MHTHDSSFLHISKQTSDVSAFATFNSIPVHFPTKLHLGKSRFSQRLLPEMVPEILFLIEHSFNNTHKC